jgi:hypothetical protein
LLYLGFVWFGLVAGSAVSRDRSADVEFAKQFEYGDDQMMTVAVVGARQVQRCAESVFGREIYEYRLFPEVFDFNALTRISKI